MSCLIDPHLDSNWKVVMYQVCDACPWWIYENCELSLATTGNISHFSIFQNYSFSYKFATDILAQLRICPVWLILTWIVIERWWCKSMRCTPLVILRSCKQSLVGSGNIFNFYCISKLNFFLINLPLACLCIWGMSCQKSNWKVVK
jgi:hypothetical protein